MDSRAPAAAIAPHAHGTTGIILALCAMILIGTGLGLRDPWPADEPRFALVAKEMVETGQWFFPARGGELYPDKPPVFMWAIALSYRLTGSMKLAFLLPSALCALLTLYLVYDLGKRLWRPEVGLWAAGLLLATLQFTLQAKTAQIDAMVCAWITVACYGLLRHLLQGPQWGWYWIGWAFMGLGVITKGVGFLPVFMLLPYLLVRYRYPLQSELPHSWRWWAGPLVFALVICLWLLPMLWLVASSGDPALQAYRDNILLKQTATRYADSWHHLEPFWYYLVSVIPLFWLPLTLMLPWLWRPWTRALRAGDRRIWLPLMWVILVLLFFSLSPGKRGVYILPAVPMLALVAAPYASDALQHRRLGWLIWAVVGFLATFLVGAAIAGGSGRLEAPLEDSGDATSAWMFLGTIGLAGLTCLAASWRRRWWSWPMFTAALWLLYSTWGYTLLNPLRTPHHILAELERQLEPGTAVAMIKFREQFLLFSPFPIVHFGYLTEPSQQDRAAWSWMKQHPGGVLVAPAYVSLDCFDSDAAIHLGFAHRRDWLLYREASMSGTCATDGSDPSYEYQPSRVYRQE